MTVTGAITLSSTLTATAEADTTGVTVAGGVALGGSRTEATLDPIVKAGIDGGTVHAGAAITSTARYNATCTGSEETCTPANAAGVTNAADADSGSFGGGILAAVSGAYATATEKGIVDNVVGSGASLSAGTAITLLSVSWASPHANAYGITHRRHRRHRLEPGDGRRPELDARTDGGKRHLRHGAHRRRQDRRAAPGRERLGERRHLRLGQRGRGRRPTSARIRCSGRARPNFAQASLGSGTISLAGPVVVLAKTRADASATAEGLSLAGGISVGGSKTTAEITPDRPGVHRRRLGDDDESAAISVTAQMNGLQNDNATATSHASSGAILFSLSGGDSSATNSPTTQAYSAGDLSASGDDQHRGDRDEQRGLVQHTVSRAESSASAQSKSNATASGTTEAWLAGDVGDATHSGGTGITISASGADSARATSQAFSLGLISGQHNESHATAQPTHERVRRRHRPPTRPTSTSPAR